MDVNRKESHNDGKKTYYVKIGSKEVLEDPGAAEFEFEIRATHDEIDKLQELFEEMSEAEIGTFLRAHVPFVEYRYDADNDLYDDRLLAVYRLLHELGTPETKKHIESMGVLAKAPDEGAPGRT